MHQADEPRRPDWVPRLISEFRACTDDADRLFSNLTAAQLNWRPNPDTWSVGQCLDHLLNANDLYLPAIAIALDRQPAAFVDNIKLGWLTRWFIRGYIAHSPETKKGRSPRKILPRSNVDSEIVEWFTASNRRACELVRRSGGHDVNRVRFPNPFIPVLRFTVGAGLEIMAKHERRHIIQARRVLEMSGFPK